jgi:hypothetical protein
MGVPPERFAEVPPDGVWRNAGGTNHARGYANPGTYFSDRAMAIWMLGLYLFLHGMPLVASSLGKGRSNPGGVADPLVVSEARDKQIGQFLHQHFGSPEEFRTFGLRLGGALTLLGIGSFIWAHLLFKRAQAGVSEVPTEQIASSPAEGIRPAPS